MEMHLLPAAACHVSYLRQKDFPLWEANTGHHATKTSVEWKTNAGKQLRNSWTTELEEACHSIFKECGEKEVSVSNVVHIKPKQEFL